MFRDIFTVHGRRPQSAYIKATREKGVTRKRKRKKEKKRKEREKPGTSRKEGRKEEERPALSPEQLFPHGRF